MCLNVKRCSAVSLGELGDPRVATSGGLKVCALLRGGVANSKHATQRRRLCLF